MSENINGIAAARDKDMPPAGPEGRGRGRKRRKVSYLTINKIYTVDYKDLNILKRFLNDRGKIVSSRQTGATAKQQRMIARAIRRARELALLPYVVTDFIQDRREYQSNRPPRGPRQEPPAPPAEAVVATETAAEAAPQAAPEAIPESPPEPTSEPVVESVPEAAAEAEETTG